MSKILIVEDEPKVAGLLKVYAVGEGHEVLLAADGLSALEKVVSERPDIVILDLMLPGLPGQNVCREIRGHRDPQVAATGIIMLTALSDDDSKVEGLDIGADDYVTKPFSPREVMARVRSLLRRRQQASAASGARASSAEEGLSFGRGWLQILPEQHLVRCHGQAVQLTPTEFALLELLASEPERVLTREQLIEKALGYDYEGFNETIYVHIKNLRGKIEPNPKKPIFIQTVHGVGYRFHDPSPEEIGQAAS